MLILYSVALSALAVCLPLWAQEREAEPDRFLKTYVHLSDHDLQRMKAGTIVVKLLPTTITKEVAAAGVVRLNVPAEFFLREYRDTESFKKAPEVLQIKRLSSPPQLSDFQELRLPTNDLRDLSDCRAGECKIKLSAKMIQRLRREFDSDEPIDKAANRTFRELLVEYVSSYTELGNRTMITYVDKKAPQCSADEFMQLLGAFPFLEEYAPEFRHYLSHFPEDRPPGMENFFYWSQEKFGLKPVLSITHVMLAESKNASSAWHIIASKQIYASHYFQASLGLTIVTDADSDHSRPSCWMIYVNRSRSDGLTGWLSSIKRAIVSARVRSGIERNIRSIKNRLETNYSLLK
jgi:hypothetical protein